MSQPTIENDTLKIQFNNFDLNSYELFLTCKKLPESNLDYDHESDSYTISAPARFAHLLGVQNANPAASELPLSAHLFDYQQFAVKTALQAKRFAVWMDTGLGKTFIGCEYARQVAHCTGGRVLIITPLNIIGQWKAEAAKWFALDLHQIASRDEMRLWCAGPHDGSIAIVNPEKFIPRDGEDQKVSEVNMLAGVVLDESSLLKSGGGTIKWAIIHSCRGIEYKLSMTATPAPNDTMEYASQGSFLEKLRSEGEILWTFFVRTKEGDWKVKDHAKDAFYRFMSSWSIYLRNPARYGFADNLKDLPPPQIITHQIEPTQEQIEFARTIPTATGQIELFKSDSIGMTARSKQSQAAKGFVYDGNKKPVAIASKKPEFVANLIWREMEAGHQVLVWTMFDEEAAILAERLKSISGIELLTGKVKQDDRPPIIERFRNSETRCLITRASMLGHGLNFQFCTSMVFSGFDDSFELYYQAVRRAYRYGQTKPVRVHIPYIKELEGVIWDNVRQKQNAFDRDTAIMEQCYIRAMKGIYL